MVAAVLVPIAIVTVLIRAVPFGVRRSLGSSPLVDFLGVTMPVGVMTVLVIYTLAGSAGSVAGLAPALIARAGTVGVHLWLRRPAVSILGGTVLYVILVNWVF